MRVYSFKGCYLKHPLNENLSRVAVLRASAHVSCDASVMPEWTRHEWTLLESIIYIWTCVFLEELRKLPTNIS